jgi:hypothetical protein
MTTTYEELKTQLQDSSRTVTQDMLTRLESKVPKEALGTYNMPKLNLDPPVSSVEARIKTMEEQTQKLKEMMSEMLSVKASPSDLSVASPETLKAIAEDLLVIVATFNKSLGEWFEKTGCVANFTWKYAPHKMLEVAEVDAIIYRKPAPSELTIKEVLENAPTEANA